MPDRRNTRYRGARCTSNLSVRTLQAPVLVSGVVTLVLASAVPVKASAQQSTTPGTTAKSLVLDQVTVVDVERGKLVPTQRVVITGNRIRAVGALGTVKIPNGARVVPAKGKYLLPGFWDMHHHPNMAFSHLLLVANGVTGFRDAWSPVPLDTLRQWRREILAGTRAGPPRQILAGGVIFVRDSCTADGRWDREGHGGWSGELCVVRGDSADARRLMEALKAAGAEMLKIYQPSWEVYAAARRMGLRFGGHSSLKPPILPVDRSDSGASILDHSGAIGRYCWRAGWEEQAGGEEWKKDSLPSLEKCRAMAERLRRNGTWWVPTCIGFGGCGGPRADAVYERFRELMTKFSTFAVLNPYAPDSTGRNVLQSAMPDLSQPPDSSIPMLMRFAGKVDMPMLTGTDVVGWWPPFPTAEVSGFAIHGELAMDVAEGLTPVQALQAATINPAKFLHATDSLGTVAAGKLADLVLLDADPLADITNTTLIRAVVANGRYFDRAALDSLLAQVQAEVKTIKRP